MTVLGGELRRALRGLVRKRSFAIPAVLSLGLGLGANAAVFTVASALLLRPLPYADAHRLVILWNRSPGLGITEDWFSTAQYFDVRSSAQSFEQVAIAIGGNQNLTGTERPERVGTLRVSSNLLPMLGARPVRGRLFGPSDDVPGTTGTAILGHATWMRRYGGDPGVVGRTLALNGQPYEIVGVLEEGFDVPREVLPTLGGALHSEVLLPLPLDAEAAHVRNREDYNLLGKLKPGVTVAQARAEMDALTARLRHDHPGFYPPNGGLTFDIVPLHEQVVGDVRRALGVLTAAVALVLLVACVNVVNLLLARAAARQRDFAVRAAIGASRGRLLREQLAEGLLLSFAGGGLGLLFCLGGVRALLVLGAASVPRLHEIEVGPLVLAFTALLSLLVGLALGLVPAGRLSPSELQGALREGLWGSSAGGGVFARGLGRRRLLVAGQLALCFVLLVAAGLLVRSFARVQRVPPGFNPASLLTFELVLAGPRYSESPAVLETYKRLWERLSALPGVTAAGGISALPLSQMMAWGPITVEGRTPLPGEAFVNVDIRVVGGDYFRALEIPLLRGRLFDEHDTRDHDRVILVDERMAEQLWPGQDPLGKRVRSGGFDAQDAPWLTVVGVVGHIKQDRLDGDARIALYHPHAQYPTRALNVTVRSRADPAGLSAAAGREVRSLDPDLPLHGVRTMADRVEGSLARRRFSMLLLTLLAGLALVLGAVGTYGVLAYQVSQGTRELGIRLALGATPRRVLAFVLGQGMAMALLGVAAGLAVALALTRLMHSLLFEVESTDPLTFGVVAALLLLVALAAGYLPARAAALVDPAVSLRTE